MERKILFQLRNNYSTWNWTEKNPTEIQNAPPVSEINVEQMLNKCWINVVDTSWTSLLLLLSTFRSATGEKNQSDKKNKKRGGENLSYGSPLNALKDFFRHVVDWPDEWLDEKLSK